MLYKYNVPENEVWSCVLLQCPLDIPNLDKAAALPIAAATRVMDLRQYSPVSNMSNISFIVFQKNVPLFLAY